MDNLIVELSKIHPKEIKNFISWYNTQKYKQPIGVFASLSSEGQGMTILKYTVDKYNLSVHFNSHTYAIFHFDALKAEEDISNDFDRIGEVTDIIEVEAFPDNYNFELSLIYAIIKLFNYIKKVYND